VTVEVDVTAGDFLIITSDRPIYSQIAKRQGRFGLSEMWRSDR
jgi:hypothetical protein